MDVKPSNKIGEYQQEITCLIKGQELQTVTDYLVRFIQRSFWARLTERKISTPISIVSLFLLLYLVGILINVVFGMFTFDIVPIGFAFLNGVAACVILIFAKWILQQFLGLLESFLVEQILLVENLVQLRNLLLSMFNWRRSIVTGIVFSSLIHALFILNDILSAGNLIQALGIGFIIVIFIFDFFWGTAIYILFKLMQFLAQIRSYSFQLFSFAPSQSEVVDKLVSIINVGIYMLAVISIFITISLSFYSLQFSLPPIWFLSILIWGPGILIFSIGHYSLTRIIGEAKRNRLNSIQQHIQDLYDEKDVVEKAELEKMNKLFSLHAKVLDSSNTAIDIRVIFNFVNSLLLPLPAFILANWTEISEIVDEIF